MSSVSKKSVSTLIQPLPLTPQTFKDVKNLNLRDLKRLCIDANIKTDGVGRNSLEILLCFELNILTCGNSEKNDFCIKEPKIENHLLDKKQLLEFQQFSPNYLLKLPGWTKQVPDIDLDLSMVKKYLLNCQVSDYDKTSLRQYKLTRAYQHLDAKHLNNVSFNPIVDSDTFCAVKASCLPSQSGEEAKTKYLHIILDQHTSEPYGAFCTCTVGLTQACSHIGALLFLLAEVVSRGENLPEDKAVTENLCSWTNPKGFIMSSKDIDIIPFKLLFYFYCEKMHDVIVFQC